MIRNGQTTNTLKEMQTPEYHYLCCELIKSKITTYYKYMYTLQHSSLRLISKQLISELFFFCMN